MERLILVCLLTFAFLSAHAQTLDNGFVRPWLNRDRAFVLDGRYYNFQIGGKDVDWTVIKRDARVAGVLLRATGPNELRTEVVAESQYPSIRKKVKSHGLLWGSYHQGLSGTVMSARDQADFYLKHIGGAQDDEVLALDLEIIQGHQIMTLADAKAFIERIFERTGRYPVMYLAGSSYDKILEVEPDTTVFKNTPLWFARFEDNITKCMERGARRGWWGTYTLWQFASERNCELVAVRYCEGGTVPVVCPFGSGQNQVPWVPVVRTDQDVNVYNGTVEELRKKWPFTFKKKK